MLKKNGQALLLVFLLLLIVGTMGGTLAHLWSSESKARGYERYGLDAFYLAQAGLERGKIYAAYTGTTPTWDPCDTDTNPACWYQDISAGWYKFNVMNDPDNLPNGRIIQSKGRVVTTAANEVMAECRLEVKVDIVTQTAQPWTWKEW